MPLIQGKSKKSFGKNVETEMDASKPQKQSLAIAYAMKRKAQKKAMGGPVDPVKDDRLQSDAKECDMCGGAHSNEEHESDRHDDKGEPEMCDGGMYAEGGQITDNYQSASTSGDQTHEGSVDPQETYVKDHAGNFIKQNKPATSESDRDLNQHGAVEEGEQGGGQGFHGETYAGNPGNAHDQYSETEDGDGQDMVGRIMAMRQKMYSEGGKVSNQDTAITGDMPNEFDDLHLRDDLESSYTGANSGDELSDAREDHDREDMISRIMKSRAKKDRLPNPR